MLMKEILISDFPCADDDNYKSAAITGSNDEIAQKKI